MEALPPCCHSFYARVLGDAGEISRNAIAELVEEIESALKRKVHPPEGLDARATEKPLPKVRGYYDPKARIIVLSDRRWCRKTLVHELLHAISCFLRTPELLHVYEREADFVEGLTEFLTGYVLYLRHRECYAKWIAALHPVCSISYEQYVRLFGAAAQTLIPIRDFVEIYVHDPSTEWRDRYTAFLDRYGLKDFLINKPKKERKKPSLILLEDLIRSAIREKLGADRAEEFNELLWEAPLDTVLDYSRMLQD